MVFLINIFGSLLFGIDNDWWLMIRDDDDLLWWWWWLLIYVGLCRSLIIVAAFLIIYCCCFIIIADFWPFSSITASTSSTGPHGDAGTSQPWHLIGWDQVRAPWWVMVGWGFRLLTSLHGKSMKIPPLFDGIYQEMMENVPCRFVSLLEGKRMMLGIEVGVMLLEILTAKTPERLGVTRWVSFGKTFCPVLC